MKRLLLLLPLVTSLWLVGCQSTLQPGGAYAPVTTNGVPILAPDRAFYVADSAFSLAYITVDTAFAYEKNNRLVLWQLSPEIKHTFDRLRPTAVVVRDRYIAARTAYIANPTPAGLAALEAALSKVQQLSAAIAAALPK